MRFEKSGSFMRYHNGVHTRLHWLAVSGIPTGGGLEYLGEWHSHPKGASAAASKDDRKALTLLSAVMAEDARPAIMLIVGEDEIRLYVRDHLGPVGSAA